MVEPAGNPRPSRRHAKPHGSLGMRGVVLFDVDNIPICAILRSLFTQEGTLPERSVAGWGGGACAGGVPLRRPGRPPESGGSDPSAAQKATPWARLCELARPGLRRGRVRERLKARRRRAFPYGPDEGDGERRSGGEILSALRDGDFVRAGNRGNPAGRGWIKKTAHRDRATPSEGMERTSDPATGGATFPRGIGGVTASMPVGPFAPESKTGVPKIAERGAPGRHPSLTKAPTARRSAPPVFVCRTPRAKAAGSRGHAGDQSTLPYTR